jgi:hypothetical protein
MTINLKKCTLYIRPNNKDGVIEYTVQPKAKSTTKVDGCMVYDFDIVVNNPQPIKIIVAKRTGTKSHLIVERVEYNNQLITDLNSVGFLRTNTGEVKRNHGYVDSEGEFVIKLHTNPVSLNYLNYLLSLTKTN